MNGSSDFNKGDEDLIAQALRDQIAVDAASAETPPAEPPAAPAPPAPAPAPEATAPATAPAAPAPEAAPPAPAPAPAEEPNKGDPRAALRASRHAERQHRARVEELQRENDELRKKVPEPDALPVLSDKAKTDLESYAPEALSVIEARDAEILRLREQIKQAPAAPKAAEFVPDVLPDHLQDAVDGIDELADWQHDPAKAAAWEAAKAADGFLHNSGAWKGKPVADRLKEAVKMVKLANPNLIAQAPAPDPHAVAAAVIDALPITPGAPKVGDLKSGQPVHNELPDYHRMVREGKSDEDIMASLGR